jgi:hypothetical protein
MAYHKSLRGSDLHAPSNELVEWNGAGVLSKLKVVTLDGMGVVYPQVRINDVTSDFPFGVVQVDMAQGKAGYITCLGFMFEVDTSAWPVGTLLYCDTNGNLVSGAQGAEIAEVVKQDANFGIIYVLALGAFIANASGDDFWSTQGNTGTSLGNFLGTTDAAALRIKTNNLEVAQFDVQGRFAIGSHNPDSPLHIKSYPGYAGTGLRTDTFALTSDTSSLVPSYTINMIDGQVARVKFQVTARQGDGAERASFTRSMLIYKQGGNVQIQGPDWTSDFTVKSTNAFDIGYTLSPSAITFAVQNANAVDTYWAGHVEMEFIAGAT